ncbi:hypothetical protein AAHA92_20330 [Salvia divinorum]|uniref:Uncharacterized protein n=1 Tax=Salvia divinorum TaxID=28513 RepID=A0ABD1GGV1_SALDI
MASPSSSSSAPSKSSQPLHNFELPPLLKWHSKDGKSAGTQKRYRTMKSLSQQYHAAAAAAVPASSSSPLRRSPSPAAAPPSRPEPPLLHLVAAAALFEADLPPPPPPHGPLVAVGGETKEPALDDEFERMSLLREESLRHYRGSDWRSEADQSAVIAYRRNPQKKPASSSSSSAKNRHSSNPAREVDVYRKNHLNKTSISPSPTSYPDERRPAAAGEDLHRRSPLKKPAFAASPALTIRPLSYLDSEDREKSKAAAGEIDAYRNPSKKSFSDSYSEERRSDAYSFKKSEFASSSSWKKHDWFNKSSADAADPYPKSPFHKKIEFVSKSKQVNISPSNSEVKVKIEKEIMVADAAASNPKQHPSKKPAYASSQMKLANSDAKVKIEKYSTVEEAAASNPKHYQLKQPAFPSQADSVDKMKSKVVEDSHLPPKKKSSFAFASPINAEVKKPEADACPKIPLLKPKLEESDAAEKKSKPAESDAVKIKIEPKEVKKEVENPKKETDLTGDDAEETRVWNLRPRNPKGKAVAQQQPKSGGGGGAASKSAAEKKEKLSISISLTRQEIEEDIFALTGAKPSRRPKKRPRNVQKQMDVRNFNLT